jgi:hypothetical protein
VRRALAALAAAGVLSLGLPASSSADDHTLELAVPPELGALVCSIIKSNTQLDAFLAAAQVRICTRDPNP